MGVEGDHDYAYSRALRLSVIPLIRRGTCSACTRALRIITGRAEPQLWRDVHNRGYWLCVFAPRSQLIELVLIERAFRERMLRELAPECWVAPSLAPARS